MPSVLNKILIVAQSDEDALSISAYLEDRKSFITFANSYEEALTEILNNFFEVVLIDVSLKNQSGLKLAKFLKENSFNKPVIGILNENQNISAQALGFDVCFVKPWDELDVIKKIGAAILVKKQERAHTLKYQIIQN